MGNRVKLSTVREELASVLVFALPDGTSVIDHLPDSVTPPCCLIGWSDPWLKLVTSCNYQTAMEIICIAQRIEPGGQFEVLEDTVASILPAIKRSNGFIFVDVTAPYPMNIGGVDYLAASVNITYDMED